MDDPQKHLNYFRLSFLLKQGTRVLQKYFRYQYKSVTNTEWIDGPEFGETFVITLGKSVYKSSKNIQKDLLDRGDVSAWDITLLSSILSNISFTPRSNNNLDDKNKWNKSKQNLRELSEVRNKHAHLAEKSITPTEFSKLWEQATNAILFFGGDRAVLEEIRTCDNIEGIQLINNDDTAYSNEENELRARKLREDGNSAFREGKFDRAVTIYSQAINLTGLSDVEKGMLFSNRAYSYIKLLEKVSCEKEKEEKSSLALEDSKSVMELRPTWWKGYYRAGQVFQFKRDFHAAEIAFNQALGLDPSQQEVKRARDECRFDNAEDKVNQHLYSTSAPQSLAEKFEKCEMGGVDLGVSVSSFIEMHQKFINSGDPKLAPLGCVFIGKLLCEGIDLPLDYLQAVDLFSKAVVAGNADAMYHLGMLYLQGRGVKRDIERAVNLFEEAAAQSPDSSLVKGARNDGVAESQYAIGKCYHEGAGKPLDYFQAAQWYAKASANGHASASNNLGGLYLLGQGVEANMERGVQFLKLAAEGGETRPMGTLALLYLEMGDLDEAQMWADRAVEGRNLNFITQKKQFDSQMTHLRASGAAFNYKEATKKLSEECPEVKKCIDAFETAMNSRPNSPVIRTMSKDFCENTLVGKIWKIEGLIRQKALEGQKYAKTLATAMDCFARVFVLLDSPSGMSHGLEIVHEFADCLRHTDIVCFFTEEMVKNFGNIVNAVLKSSQNSVTSCNGSNVNLDARICKCFLLMGSMKELVEFVRMSKVMYPEEPYFQKLFCELLGWLKQHRDGVKATDECLKLFPDDYDLLYCKASHKKLVSDEECGVESLSSVKLRSKLVKEYYLQFLKYVPSDHRRVPDAYYCLASNAMSWRKNHQGSRSGQWGTAEAMDFFKKGVEAEKKVLPCFLPYNSESKTIIQEHVNVFQCYQNSPKKKNRDPKTTTASSLSSQKVAEEEGQQLTQTLSPLQRTNPRRVDTVLQHRKSFRDAFKLLQDNQELPLTHSAKSVKSQKAPIKLTSLKEISLGQMDPNVDKVYDGFVINFTVMEDSMFGAFPFVRCVVSDDKGDFQRCNLYNLDQADPAVRKSLGFGSTFSVMNPYFRLTADEGKGIRVDDPKSVIFQMNGVEQPLCRFCGCTEPKLNCAKCKRAKYCSKECQVGDWNVLKHNLVCKERYQKCI